MFNPEGNPIERQEEKELTPIELWSQKGIDRALEIVGERFEGNEENPDKNLDFHKRLHTQSIINRVDKILAALKEMGVPVSEKNIIRGKLYGAFHDVVQEENEPKTTQEGGYEKISRVRLSLIHI